MYPTVPFAPASPGCASDHRAIAVQLQRSEIVRTYLRAFEVATGLPLVFRLPGSFQPPLHGSKRVNEFCARMIAKSETCAACLRCQQQVEEGAGQGPFTVTCHAGFAESAMPIRLDGVAIAYLQTGQVRLEQSADVTAAATGPKVRRELQGLWRSTAVMPADQYQSDLQLLNDFAHHLGTIATQLGQQHAHAEDPVATKARGFIAEHHAGPITLAATACAVGMSPFYFCKVFKRLFGTSFIVYLSRIRVANVCDLLQSTKIKICDAAFAAGFQSLSQFNRTFRQFTGKTPRAYRAAAVQTTSIRSGKTLLSHHDLHQPGQSLRRLVSPLAAA
jgi:AraC-like DNA-binding protein